MIGPTLPGKLRTWIGIWTQVALLLLPIFSAVFARGTPTPGLQSLQLFCYPCTRYNYHCNFKTHIMSLVVRARSTYCSSLLGREWKRQTWKVGQNPWVIHCCWRQLSALEMPWAPLSGTRRHPAFPKCFEGYVFVWSFFLFNRSCHLVQTFYSTFWVMLLDKQCYNEDRAVATQGQRLCCHLGVPECVGDIRAPRGGQELTDWCVFKAAPGLRKQERGLTVNYFILETYMPLFQPKEEQCRFQ